jgi:hypothetical protein
VGEGRLRESAVAELRVGQSGSGPEWLITSCNPSVDQAIAHTLPTERRVGTSTSRERVRVLLADEIAVRIEVGAGHLGPALREEAGDLCPCRGDDAASTGGKYGCLCGCHFGAICRLSLMRNGGVTVPQAAFLFTLQVAPNLGPLLMRSSSWELSLWLRDCNRNSDPKGGPLTAGLRLRHAFKRTRSGVEVIVAQAGVNRHLSCETPTNIYRSAEEKRRQTSCTLSVTITAAVPKSKLCEPLFVEWARW